MQGNQPFVVLSCTGWRVTAIYNLKTLFSSSSTVFLRKLPVCSCTCSYKTTLGLLHTCAFVHIFMKYLAVVFDFPDVKFFLLKHVRAFRQNKTFTYHIMMDHKLICWHFFFSYFKVFSLLLEDNQEQGTAFKQTKSCSTGSCGESRLDGDYIWAEWKLFPESRTKQCSPNAQSILMDKMNT